LLSRIGPIARTRIAAGWQIYLRYAVMRFAGLSKDEITRGSDFLNYGITWEDAERVFTQLSAEAMISSDVFELFRFHASLRQQVKDLTLQCSETSYSRPVGN
jgi:hypothetical protein